MRHRDQILFVCRLTLRWCLRPRHATALLLSTRRQDPFPLQLTQLPLGEVCMPPQTFFFGLHGLR